MSVCPLIRPPDPASFTASLRRLQRRFSCYADYSPQPLPTAGLIITPEIRYQSEHYLPFAEIRQVFYQLYRQTLSYAPILSSTPFQHALSWADCFAAFPAWLHDCANPAVLLERLLYDQQLLARFLFFSFLPCRFNGAGFGRYPEQLAWLQQHLSRHPAPLRILDAACGNGAGTWELAELLATDGWQPNEVILEGWTLEPLEVWAAQHQRLPHDAVREAQYRRRVQPLLQQGWGTQVTFQVVDLLDNRSYRHGFNLILCNGLLGGPIINRVQELQQVLGRLASFLLPGGVLLLADRFHDGWKQEVPRELLVRLLHTAGLRTQDSAAGCVAVKMAG